MAGNEFRAVKTTHERFAVQVKKGRWFFSPWLTVSFHDNEYNAITQAKALELQSRQKATEKIVYRVWPFDHGW